MNHFNDKLSLIFNYIIFAILLNSVDGFWLFGYMIDIADQYESITWLPTFNYQILQLPDNISVQISSIYAGSMAAGRLLGGQIMKRVHWYIVLQTSIVIAGVLVLLVLPLTSGVEPGSVTG